MKMNLLLNTAAVALIACASTAHAAPARATTKTARIHEIHCGQNLPGDERPSAPAQPADDNASFRSHAELETVNPG